MIPPGPPCLTPVLTTPLPRLTLLCTVHPTLDMMSYRGFPSTAPTPHAGGPTPAAYDPCAPPLVHAGGPTPCTLLRTPLVQAAHPEWQQRLQAGGTGEPPRIQYPL